MRIAVVTPLWPISSEPYRGQPIYKTIVPLAGMATVETFCISAAYPPLLRPRSYQYKSADPSWQPGGVKTHYLTYPTVPVVGRSLNGWLSGRALLKPLRAFQPDVILAYWIYPEGEGATLAGARLGVPVVLGSRGSDLLKIPDAASLRGVRRALRRAHSVLTVSRELAAKAVELGADQGRVHTIVNGCDTQVFRPLPRDEWRGRLGVDAAAHLIVYAGHLIAGKGLNELRDAFRALAPARPQLRLVLIGEGQMDRDLRAWAEREFPGRVTLTGGLPAPRIAEWLAASDLLCLPSYSEGCPNVVLESLSCGRPVVATTVGAIPDLVDHESGVLVPPRDAAALTRALDVALSRQWREAAIAARRRRSWEDVAQETRAVCRQAASGDRA